MPKMSSNIRQVSERIAVHWPTGGPETCGDVLQHQLVVTEQDLEALVLRHHGDGSRLVQILRDVMAVAGHASPHIITTLSRALGLPRAHR